MPCPHNLERNGDSMSDETRATDKEPDIPGLIPDESYVLFVDPVSERLPPQVNGPMLVPVKMTREAYRRIMRTVWETPHKEREIVRNIVENLI
jgi:hypothetical protein